MSKPIVRAMSPTPFPKFQGMFFCQVAATLEWVPAFAGMSGRGGQSSLKLLKIPTIPTNKKDKSLFLEMGVSLDN